MDFDPQSMALLSRCMFDLGLQFDVADARTNLTEFLLKVRDAAAGAKQTAYCPYSNFRVGACLVTSEGALVTGANVENASFPVGTCAERVAFGTAITQGYRKFVLVAVSTDLDEPGSPCGMCRQFMNEFCDSKVPIVMFDKDGRHLVQTLTELLPMAFGPEKLHGRV